MQQLKSVEITIGPDNSIIEIFENRYIGLRSTKGEVTIGTYDQDTWGKCDIAKKVHIIAKNTESIPGNLIQRLSVISLQDLEPNTYIAVEQDGGDGVIAITPLICPDQALLKRLETYFFKK